MSQPFNPKRVLRQISNPLLKEFFEHQGSPLEVGWHNLTNNQVDDIFDAWQRLPDNERKAVEIAFHDVHEMADEDGTRVIIEEGQYHGEDLTPHIELLEGSAGFGDPKIPVDANGHITSNLGIQVTHKYPQDEAWTLDPVVSLSLNGTSLRVTSKPASVDSKGHMRQGGASEQYHDLSMEAVTVVTAFRVEGTDLQVKTRTIYVPKADAESDWTTVHTGTECPSSGGS